MYPQNASIYGKAAVGKECETFKEQNEVSNSSQKNRTDKTNLYDIEASHQKEAISRHDRDGGKEHNDGEEHWVPHVAVESLCASMEVSNKHRERDRQND
jgi:hypothetical protein